MREELKYVRLAVLKDESSPLKTIVEEEERKDIARLTTIVSIYMGMSPEYYKTKARHRDMGIRFIQDNWTTIEYKDINHPIGALYHKLKIERYLGKRTA